MGSNGLLFGSSGHLMGSIGLLMGPSGILYGTNGLLLDSMNSNGSLWSPIGLVLDHFLFQLALVDS